MQWTAEIEREEVRHVNQRIDRSQADEGQPVLQPFRAGRILHAADGASDDPRTGFRERDFPVRTTVKQRRQNRRGERFQGPQPGGCQIAGDAANREAVTPVRGHADFYDRIVQAGPGYVGRANGGVGGQFDDAGVVIAKPHLPRRQHHTGAFNAPDLADFQGDAGARNKSARRGEDDFQTGSGVRGAADDRDDTITGIDLAGLQPVGVRVLDRFNDMADAE